VSKFFTEQQVMEESLKYYDGDLLPASVVKDKYLLRDLEGRFLEKTPHDMHDRLANEFTRIEKRMNPKVDAKRYFDRVRSLLDRFAKTVPQGSPMAAIGNPYFLQSLSNCFVVASPQDSIEGIFHTGLEIAQIQKRRGGAGVDLSTLRPFGARVNNAAGKSAGVPCFSDFYSHITRMIGQLGRQGALMITIDVKHPDIFHYIAMKGDLGKVTGANVSIRLSDEFLRAVTEKKSFRLQWPVDASIPQIIQDVDANELWDKIVEAAWKFAEPGLLLWDNITNTLPAHQYPNYFTLSTNPCGEIPLCAYDSCRLISQNLMGWVRNPFTESSYFDFDTYYEDTRTAQRISDGLVELELEAIKKIIKAADTPAEAALWKRIYTTGQNGRRTGLGTHALADVFLAMGVKYDSPTAQELADSIYSTHKVASYTESVAMARERGAFKVWDWKYDQKSQFIAELPEELKKDIKRYGRRNISNNTAAPTGSVAIASGTSSGIESVFRYVFDRRVKVTKLDAGHPVDFVDGRGDKWTNFRVVHPAVKKFLEVNGKECPVKGGRDFSYSIEEANKKLHKMLPDYFVTSDMIDYNAGVELQSVIQKHIDHSISRTINLPKGTTKEQVGQVYLNAWRLGLKGVTVYVDGSRDGVLITESTKSKEDKDANGQRPDSIIENHAPKRPKSLPADVHIVKVKGTDWGVIVGLMNGKPFEVFAGRGLFLPKANTIESAYVIKMGTGVYKLQVRLKDNGVEEFGDLKEIYDNNEERVITRSVCRELRHGIPVEFIVKDLSAHTGSISDFSAALSRVLKKYANRPHMMIKSCPQCGGTDFKPIEGCMTCTGCGFGKCT
jgi:ribonucleoside-diphosphate reductase alpha chain